MKSGFPHARRSGPAIGLLLATVISLSACGGGTPAPAVSPASPQVPSPNGVANVEAQPTAVPTRPGPRQPAAITPEELAAATLLSEDVRAIDPKAEYWAGFPEFNVDVKSDEDRAEGERFYIAETLTGMGESADREIQTVVMLLDTAEHGAKSYEGLIEGIEADEGGPTVGDQSIFYQQPLDRKQFDAQATVRFQHGPIVARVTLKAKGEAAGGEEMKPYAEALDRKIAGLLSGELAVPAVPPELAKLLPPEAAGKGVGPVLGTAVNGPEGWALLESSGKKQDTMAKLQAAGVKQLVFRRYRLNTDPAQVVEVVLFPFADDKGAADWVQTWLNQAKKADGETITRLDPGTTGDKSSYQLNRDLEIYELQFAKGKYLADVACLSPFLQVSGNCEPAVRSLAEAWFAALP